MKKSQVFPNIAFYITAGVGIDPWEGRQSHRGAFHLDEVCYLYNRQGLLQLVVE